MAPDLTLRLELFPADIDTCFDFYTRVLHFEVERDERAGPFPYLSARRGTVQLGAVASWEPKDPAHALPPHGVEIVFEVDDVAAERDAVVAAGWPLFEDLVDRPWGLRDFRVLDPDGTFLRFTNR
jgi:lactoylglutathione lyase